VKLPVRAGLLKVRGSMAGEKSRSDTGSPEILLEVRPRSVSGDLGPGVALPESFAGRAGEVADSIAEIATKFRSRLQKTLNKASDSGWKMDAIELRFDIAVQAEAGVIIAKATSGATFSAKLTLKAAAGEQ
jgi:Trypsin-co-occurring domain 1